MDRSGAAEVKPKVVPKIDYLCVDSVNNAVKVTTKCGEYFLIGKGAGGQTTACSLLRDLTHAYKGKVKNRGDITSLIK